MMPINGICSSGSHDDFRGQQISCLRKHNDFHGAQEGSPQAVALPRDVQSPWPPATLQQLSPHLLLVRQLHPEPLAGGCANKYICYWQGIALP